ncbi:hypothetical protein COO60DRAFT_1701687 [Scenedesmus sp. NREL 46B-D3]|nr:hypothetical protein COO60DRAFT_1701687 [Scenedesmus sp. NREL 46B-D3]
MALVNAHCGVVQTPLRYLWMLQLQVYRHELAAAAMAAAADEVWFDAAEDWAADNPEQQNADVTAEAMAIYQDLIQAEYTAPELRKIFGEELYTALVAAMPGAEAGVAAAAAMAVDSPARQQQQQQDAQLQDLLQQQQQQQQLQELLDQEQERLEEQHEQQQCAAADADGWDTSSISSGDSGVEVSLEDEGTAVDMQDQGLPVDMGSSAGGSTTKAGSQAEWYRGHLKDPLWACQGENSKLQIHQAVFMLMSWKSDFCVRDGAFEALLGMMSKLFLPEGNKLPPSYYLMKAILEVQDISSVEWHACEAGCTGWEPTPKAQWHKHDHCQKCKGKRFKTVMGKLVPVRRFWFVLPEDSIKELMSDPEFVAALLAAKVARVGSFWESSEFNRLNKAVGGVLTSTLHGVIELGFDFAQPYNFVQHSTGLMFMRYCGLPNGASAWREWHKLVLCIEGTTEPSVMDAFLAPLIKSLLRLAPAKPVDAQQQQEQQPAAAAPVQQQQQQQPAAPPPEAFAAAAAYKAGLALAGDSPGTVNRKVAEYMGEALCAALAAGEQPSDKAIQRPPGADKPVGRLPKPAKQRAAGKPEGAGKRKRKQRQPQQRRRKGRGGRGGQHESEDSEAGSDSSDGGWDSEVGSGSDGGDAAAEELLAEPEAFLHETGGNDSGATAHAASAAAAAAAAAAGRAGADSKGGRQRNKPQRYRDDT